MPTPRLVCLAALLAFAASDAARAYSEDVCRFHVQQGRTTNPDQVYDLLFNCFDLECLDGPDAGDSAAACTVSGLMTYLGATLAPTADGSPRIHASSSLHFDSSYLLGRIAGFDHPTAVDFATYVQGTDVGVFRATARTGGTAGATTGGPLRADLQPGNVAANIYGLGRMNEETSGFWLHYLPWLSDGTRQRNAVTVRAYRRVLADPASSNLDEIEAPLFHLRSWAWAAGGARPLCRLGFANGDGSCVADQRVFLHVNLLGDAVAEEGLIALGPQAVTQNADGSWQTTERSIALSGTPQALGIYLHALGDRLSHNLCLQDSPLQPASGEIDGTPYQWELRFTDTCGQVTHALHHYLETAHGSNVPPRAGDGLELVIRELAAWALAHQLAPATPRTGYPAFLRNGKLNEGFVKAMLGSRDGSSASAGKLTKALVEPCANLRVAALCRLARDGYGLDWYDGNASCSYPSFPDDTTCRQVE